MAAPDRNEQLTAALRLVVAGAALAIYFADPSEHPARRPFVNVVLAMFTAYSAAYLLAARRGRSISMSTAPWIDVGWVTLVVAVSQATSGVFYPLYLFAILCASFWGGFRQGIAVTVVSAVSFAAVGGLTAPQGIDLRLFVIRPLYLVVLGYLTAVWGGHEVRSRARLALLRDVTTLSNPRFGVEPTLARILEAIRAFYGADSCRVVIADEVAGRWIMRAASRGVTSRPAVTDLPREIAEALLPSPADAAFVIRRRAGEHVEFTVHAPGSRHDGDPAVALELLTALDADAVLSVPFRHGGSAAGRMYVVRRGSRRFERGAVEFLQHVVDQVVPLLENLRLVDRLALDAASEERRRIARNLHDSVIQPYLGLRLGLSAARAALNEGLKDEAGTHLDRLLQLADGEIQTLRGYVRELRADTAGGGAVLVDSVRRFCGRFSDATGIRVDVVTEGAPVSDRVGAEVFQIVAEALSNVRRHTAASRAEVRVDADEGQVRVTVSNDGAAADPTAFHPRSLAERAEALGGHLTVEHPARGTTAVRVEIPL